MNQFILLNTPHVLIVNKPPSIAFHDNEYGKGIVNYTRAQLGIDWEDSNNIYPVHRLDRVTSGALIFSKSREVGRELIGAFRARRVQKYYVAVSNRKPSKKQGTVAGDMTRGRRGSWLLQRSTNNPALTRFTSTSLAGEAPGTRAFLLKPETGRTHQLRVAMKALGSPVLGDSRYANAEDARKEERAYLHCAALRVVVGGEVIQVICPPTDGAVFISDGFRNVFRRWFPENGEQNIGPWFEDNKLLRSTIL